MPATYWVYILRCSDASLYVGHTSDLPDRIRRDNEGKAAVHTCSRLPITLLFSEEHCSERAACQRERQSKHWTREKKLALAEGRLATLKGISRRNRR
jgi:predicted GIY-YIG superfamily endonuclease